MDIKAYKAQATYTKTFTAKLEKFIHLIESHDCNLAPRRAALSADQQDYCMGQDVAEMVPVYPLLLGQKSQPQMDLLVAYCRFCHILEKIDRTQKEFPLFDGSARHYQNEADYLCRADLHKLYTIDEICRILGVKKA